MLRLKDTNVVPPGGFRFKTDTGVLLSSANLSSLVGDVCDYRKANGFAQSPDTRGEIEQQICEGMDPHTRGFNCNDRDFPTPLSAIGWRQVASFVKVLATMIVKHPAFVPQEEAERRAEICSLCPYNAPLSGCGVCKAGIEEAMGFLGGRHTKLLGCPGHRPQRSRISG